MNIYIYIHILVYERSPEASAAGAAAGSTAVFINHELDKNILRFSIFSYKLYGCLERFLNKNSNKYVFKS